MTLCVLDASVVLAWSFKDEVSPYATFIVRSVKNARAVAPIIWPLEVNNALISAVRRERIDELVANQRPPRHHRADVAGAVRTDVRDAALPGHVDEPDRVPADAALAALQTAPIPNPAPGPN